MLSRRQERLRRFLPGGSGGFTSGSLIVVVLSVAVVWRLSGIYFVTPEEEGIVLRFGQVSAINGPGQNYHLPDRKRTVLNPIHR